MVSNYSLYIKERLNEEIIEDDKGFVTYQFENDVLWLRDMFVRREYRNQKVARNYLNQIISIAKERNIHKLHTHVCTGSNGWNLSFDMLCRDGFKIDSVKGTLIILTLGI